MRCTGLALIPVVVLATHAATVPDSMSGDEVLAQVAKADAKRQAATRRYTGTRQYFLKNERLAREAGMIVQVTVEPENGKHFRVVSASGSESVHKKVFQKLLDAELEAGRQGKAALNLENYSATLIGSDTINGRSTFVLELKPKHKTKYLIEGKAWVDAADFQVVRLEGRPAASLSFWTGRPQITCEFQKVNGVWLASRSHSLAKSKLLGSTELIIEFQSYDLNSKPLVAHNIR